MSALSLNSLYDDILRQVVLYLDPRSRNSFLKTSKRFNTIGSATVSDKVASLMSSYAPELLSKITHPLPLSIRIRVLAQSPNPNTFNRFKAGLNEEGISLLVKNYLSALFYRQIPLYPLLKKDLPNEVSQYLDDQKSLKFLENEKNSIFPFALATVQKRTIPKSFQLLNPVFKNDPLIVLKAIKNAAPSDRLKIFKSIGDELKNDTLFFSKALKIHGLGIQFANEELKSNKSMALQAVMQNPKALQFVSSELKNDVEVVLAAVKKDGTCIRFASDELKNNLSIALAAVEQSSAAYRSLNPDMQNNEQVALILIEKHCYFTKEISSRFQNSKPIALAAVKRYSRNLEILSPQMRSDQEVQEAALKSSEKKDREQRY